MIHFAFAGPEQAEQLTQLRLEVLRDVNHLPVDHAFAEDAVQAIDRFWRSGDHATVIAMDGDACIGCATMCYYRVMPTFDHPTGLRAHLMNVYTRSSYRRQGIARSMVSMLVEHARSRHATEVSLDATEDGRRLYESLGFTANAEGMTLRL